MRNEFIDFARGFIMLFVVYAHALQTVLHGNPNDPVQFLIRIFQMPALFLISGFVVAFSSSIWQRGGVWAIKNKASRLLLPTIAWIWLWYFVRVAVGFEPYSPIVPLLVSEMIVFVLYVAGMLVAAMLVKTVLGKYSRSVLGS